MAQSPSEITVPLSEAVSEALDRPVTELPPLADAINLTGLDAVVSAPPSHDVSISFTYAGLHIVVRSYTNSDTTVYVFPREKTQSDWDAAKQ